MDVTGNFVVVWQDFRNIDWDIYFQRFTSTGAPLGANTKVNDDAGSAYQKLPSISMDGAGNFVIVWEDNRYGQTNTDIFGQRYFSNGNPDGANYRIVTDGPNDGESSPVVYANNSDIIFSWHDNRRSAGWDIFAKIVGWNWNGVTDVEIIENNIPKDFSLSHNYPNPFNPKTVISYQLPVSSDVTLKIYDVLGNEIVTLVDEYKSAGEYEVEFNTSSINHQPSSGIYFYQLKAREFVQTKKMVLIK